MFKNILRKTAVKPSVNKITVDFQVMLNIDSSLSDDQVPDSIIKQINDIFSNNETRVIIDRVVRNGDGVIESLKLYFKYPLCEE